MLNRRTVLATSTAAAAIAAVNTDANAATTVDVKIDPYNQTPEQKAFHATRFDKLDQEGLMDFAEGFKKWNDEDREGSQAHRNNNAYLKSRGLSIGGTDLGYEECLNVMLKHPPYAAKVRLDRSAHALMWDRAMRAFHGEADKYLSLMEETDNAGPGSLELNPDMELPDYACHEIHAQPGGYVGDPFAGWVYHKALTQAYYRGDYQYDELHLAVAQHCPKPVDGKVRRILDMGCASGLSTTAFKERFTEAEVWGIDVGGPLVRYAHHRAVKKDLDVHFAQRLAEDTKFPDNHFDIASDLIMFHEVSANAAEEIVTEIFRILRPGGVFNHVDGLTEGNSGRSISKTIPRKARLWVGHRHNLESWIFEYLQSDFPGLLRAAGFEVDLDLSAPRDHRLLPTIIATKPA